MTEEQLKAMNRNRERRNMVREAIDFWEGVGDQDNHNFKLQLQYLPGNWKIAPHAARFTEAEMVPIRAAKLHSLNFELKQLDTEFEGM